jgi:hypothetical protein
MPPATQPHPLANSEIPADPPLRISRAFQKTNPVHHQWREDIGARVRIGRTGRQRKPRKLTRSLLQRPHRWADHAEYARPRTRPCPMRRQFRTPTHLRSLAPVSQPWHQRPVWTQGQTECRSSGRLAAEPSRGPRHLKATYHTRERGGLFTRRLSGTSISATWIGSEVDILRRSSKPKGWPSRDTVYSLLGAHRASYARPGYARPG